MKGRYIAFLVPEANPDGYQYSWFSEHYWVLQGKLDLVMRQDHQAGEKLFLD